MRDRAHRDKAHKLKHSRQPNKDRSKLMSKPRALVIGGSVGGLFAANLLRTTGWDVTVFERAKG